MSEAQVAMAGSWTERERTIRPKARSGSRSLGAALRDAGLPDAAPDAQPDRRGDLDETPVAVRSHGTPPTHDATVLAESRSPRLAFFAEPEIALPVVRPLHHEAGVVSPPPWLRAARRGRWRARMLNTFGWVMTLVVAGSIIGVAGRYLALSPPALESMLHARQ